MHGLTAPIVACAAAAGELCVLLLATKDRIADRPDGDGHAGRGGVSRAHAGLIVTIVAPQLPSASA